MEKRSVTLKSTVENSNAFRLDGKGAIVTGAASGIGLAIARRFALHGASVYLLDINGEAAETAARQIVDAAPNLKDNVHSYGCDVSSQEQVNSAFAEIFARSPIDILVNNAGISHIGKLESTSEQDFDKIFRVNVKGYYNCMRAVIEHMKGRKSGVIVNLASIAGWAGLADRFAYSMSKGAVIAMTYSVARDYLAHNIRCNCISPGRVHTPFVDDYLRKNYPGREKEMFEKLANTQPIGRMGQPDEIAALAQFLCSNEAAYITGTDYPIDGGFGNLHG
jgi:2-keto-3-deoxy-L-fuconate dehydrogenase